MAFPGRMTDERDPVVLKLVDGHYDRELAEFRVRLNLALQALARMQEAIAAETVFPA
jgi:hypothetical protein